jgi:hypothetical protein
LAIFSAVDPDSTELHHVFSQAVEFLPWFRSLNIDINKYLIALPAGLHRLIAYNGLHTGPNNWNALWRQFRAANPNATREQVFNYAKQLIKKFNIGSFPGANLSPSLILFVDLCKYDPYAPQCVSRGGVPAQKQ